MAQKIRKAVSLVFRNKSKVFFIKRQNFLHHFPGYIAFPGGKVGAEDEEADDPLFEAACREAQEELGIDVKDAIKSGSILRWRKIAIATTPDFNPYRFETYFILFETKTKFRFKVDTNEAAESGWVDPYDIVRKYNAGEALLVPPVRKMYSLLSESHKFDEVVDFDIDRPKGLAQVESIKNLLQLMPKSNTLPPAERTNCFVIGDGAKICVDPSPKDTEEYRSLIATLEKHQLDKIIITHHHGDHHQFAPQVANHFKLPLYMSLETKNLIIAKKGEDYFLDCEIVLVEEGDTLGQWIGQSIKAYRIPGHDIGHIGLAPEKLNWFIVGDLFQGVGTVVVGGEEGNMKDYFESLKKVISLSPQCVIPSHGIALGGTNILQRTLEHRKLREKQILDLYLKQPDPSYILKTLYFDIPRHLHSYAMANIRSHLKKLEDEGRLS